jgi:hypothetical protein
MSFIFQASCSRVPSRNNSYPLSSSRLSSNWANSHSLHSSRILYLCTQKNMKKNLLKLHDDGKFGAHKKKHQTIAIHVITWPDTVWAFCSNKTFCANKTFWEEIWQNGLDTNIAVCVCSVTGGDALIIEYYKS